MVFEHVFEYHPWMGSPSPDAQLALEGQVLDVRILRWWWVDHGARTWAADIQVPGHGLVSGVPGSWLRDPGPTVPRGRRGRVVSERRNTLGERFGPRDPRA